MQLLKNNISFLKITKFFFLAFIFCLPFNINVIVYSSQIFSSGNFNPYVSFFIYLTDFLFLFSMIAWGISIFRKEFKEEIIYGKTILFVLLFLFILIAEISVFLAKDHVISILLLIRLFEFGVLYFFIINKAVHLDSIINVFIASVSLQALIAIIQFLFQGSIGLQFLGESVFSPSGLGVAKMNTVSEAVVRPYGTFPHSNILAGYLVISILLTYHRALSKEILSYPLLLLQIGALILTFSRTAFIALFIAWFIYISVKNTKIPYKLILLIFVSVFLFVVIFNLEDLLLNRVLFTDMSSLDERVFYFNLAKAMLIVSPFGAGMGNFTLLMQDFTNTKILPWDFQPVHNVYMLIANELGIIGFIFFAFILITFAVLLFNKMKRTHNEKKALGTILLCTLSSYIVLGLFDHYLFSLYQGLILSFLLFGIYGKYITEDNR